MLHDILEQEQAHLGLSLFRGDAVIERSFLINKECHSLVENLEDSLVVQRVLYNAVCAVGGVTNVNITKAMIHLPRNASEKRVEAAVKKAAEEETEANKRK